MKDAVNTGGLIPEVQTFLNKPHGHYIGGRWVSGETGALIDVKSPGTGQRVAQVAAASAADVDKAVVAARAAFDGGLWPALVPADRARLMFRLADLIEQHAATLSQLETIDSGIPLSTMKLIGIKLAADQMRYFAGWVTKLDGDTISNSRPRAEGRGYLTYTVKEPVGVVGQIIPWNFPFGMAIQKLAPALATGCTIVMKPAEETPLTALYLADLVDKAGFPAGVFNLVNGYGRITGSAIANHGDIDKVAFTGSTDVGKEIISAATGNLKKITLELGGKSPVILMPDANLEEALPAAARAIFFLAGQNCMAGSRLLVHADIYDEVLEGLDKIASALSVGSDFSGDSFGDAYDVGPLISERHMQRVLSYIDIGLGEGARLLTGGKKIKDVPGYFVKPTIFCDCTSDMQIVRSEIFGPVLTVQKFETTDLNAIAAMANDTDYGLSASIWTADIAKAHLLAGKIKSGQVGINVHAAIDTAVPFGGFKQSGWGREFGREGLEPYLQTKAVTVYL